MPKDPLGLAPHTVYMPDLSPEELERHVQAATRAAIFDEQMEQDRTAYFLR
jgi:hypothetical protein